MTTETVSPPVISFKECRDEEIAGFFANEGRKFHPVLPSCKEAAQSRVVSAPHFSVKGVQKNKQRNERKNESRNEYRATARFASAGTAPSIQLCRSTLADNLAEENRFPVLLKPAPALETLLTNNTPQRQRNRAAKVLRDPLEDKPVMQMPTAQKSVKKSVSLFTGNLGRITLSNNKPEKKTENDVPQHTAVLFTEETSPPDTDGQVNSVQESLLERLEIADEQLRSLVQSWSKLPVRFKETIRALVEVSSGNSDNSDQKTEEEA